MRNLVLLGILATAGVLCAIAFVFYCIFLLINREKQLNRVVLNYIFVGIISCVGYGLAHNLMVNPFIFNSLINLNLSEPQVIAYFVCWAYRAVIYFLVFSIWLRVLLKRAKTGEKYKTRIFRVLFLHAILISTAWITDFEKLLYYKSVLTYHHFLHWIGGIIGSVMLLLLEYVFMEKKILKYLDVKTNFQTIRSKLLFFFLGIPSMMFIAITGILMGCLGIDSNGTIILKTTVFSLLFLLPLVMVIIKVTNDFNGNLLKAVYFLKHAGNYDFTQTIDIMSRDEFGDLGNSLVVLKDNINDIISIVRNSSGKVRLSADTVNTSLNTLISGSSEFFEKIQINAQKRVKSSDMALNQINILFQNVEQTFGKLQDQSSVLESSSVLLRDMIGSIKNIGLKTGKAAEVAQSLFAIAQDGKEFIQDTLTGIREIESYSKKIDGIIAVLNDITEETKILAINAQIESARASSGGRGFAVVASQMRLLAENSAQNSSAIFNHIKDIYSQVNDVLLKMEKSREGFLAIHREGENSRNITTDLSSGMEKLSGMLADITRSTDKIYEITRIVNSFSELLRNVMREIKEVFMNMKVDTKEETEATRENADFVKKQIDGMKQAILENLNTVQKLSEEIDKFKV
ncbi:MAG: hypothetical protein JW969_09375 [Spirochaetales bacterium]|nr:hypothetical protein [Spirochaetales bacterium]